MSDKDQAAVKKAIKTSRIMGALPYFGRIPEPLKRNITSLEDEVQEIGYQHVNLESGHVFQTRSPSMDSQEIRIQTDNDLDVKYERMTTQGKNYKIWLESMEKTPDEEEVKAEKYARYLKQNQLSQDDGSQAFKKNVQNVLKGISKYRGLTDE